MKVPGLRLRLFALCVIAILSFFSIASPGHADEIRIYLGVVKKDIFASSGKDFTKRRTYLVVNETANQIAIITIADRTTVDETLATSVRTTVPYNPIITKDSRTFIYVSSSDNGVPVNTYRWRSSAAPALIRLANFDVLAAKRLDFEAWFYAFAAYNFESSGTFTFSKSLTLEALSTTNNTASAIALVKQYLRDRNLID